METRDTKMDRRSMRSKQAILDAFRFLVVQKENKDISVTDIVEQANIGRTTFYSHFEDILDLKRFIFSRLLRQLEQGVEDQLAENDTPLGSYQSLIPSLALFKIAAEKHAVFKTNAEAPQFGLRHLIPHLIERLETQLDEMGVPEPQGDMSRRMIATYLFNALIGLLIEWVLADMPESAEVMDSKFQRLAEPTLKLLMVE